MERISAAEALMRTALLWAERSTCVRMKVGAVLANNDLTQFVVGYNGTYKHGPNTCIGPNEPGKCGCIHAEANAIAKAGPEEKIAFLTHAPCVTCAMLLINSNTHELYYNKIYRTKDGLDILEDAGIITWKMEIKLLIQYLRFLNYVKR